MICGIVAMDVMYSICLPAYLLVPRGIRSTQDADWREDLQFGTQIDSLGLGELTFRAIDLLHEG